ncbi:hypothetical protein TNCV_3725061 [Trichonephila clavipes]|nr:hypothetical protein TNCV_3725061 [Trichonephila clavipes]
MRKSFHHHPASMLDMTSACKRVSSGSNPDLKYDRKRHFRVCSKHKNIIDTDSDDENKINNGAPVPEEPYGKLENWLKITVSEGDLLSTFARPSNGCLPDRSLSCKRRRMIRADTEGCVTDSMCCATGHDGTE